MGNCCVSRSIIEGEKGIVYTDHMVEFEWDPAKEVKNIKKHKVSFNEAATVFWDMLAATFDDPKHSKEEERYITVGISNRFRWILVSHTDREDTIRIISARELRPAERKFYERERKIRGDG